MHTVTVCTPLLTPGHPLSSLTETPDPVLLEHRSAEYSEEWGQLEALGVDGAAVRESSEKKRGDDTNKR